MRFSKICVTALSLAVFLGLTGAAFAANGANKKAQKGIRGKIVSVAKDHTTMVIETHAKKGAAGAAAAPGNQVTVTIAAGCTVSLNGQSSSVNALSAGEHVMVSPSADAATDIKIRTAGKHVKKAAA